MPNCPRLLAIIAVFLSAVAGARLTAQTPVAASGREFYVALPSVEFAFSRQVLRINITATNTATVRLSFTEYGTSEAVQIPAGGRWERAIPVDSVMLLEQEYRANRSIRIVSTEPVTVNVVNDNDGFMSEGYLALPTTSLGYDYLALCYPDTSHTPSQPNTRGSVIAVIATEDDTDVQLTPSALTFAGNSAGSTYTVTLDRGEIYQMIPAKRPGIDLSGTRINASKPVAVISGHRGVATDSISALNSLLEQMVPLSDWGQKFYSVKTPEQPRSRYRVLAQRSGTTVRVNGRIVATLAARTVAEFWSDPDVVIESTQPILLAQIGTHRASRSSPPEVDSDPSMSIVNPVDSYAERFEWSTPTMPPRVVGPQFISWKHWAIITAPTSSLGSVRLDGAAVSFTIPHSDGAYSTAVVSVNPGVHRVTSSQPVNVQLIGDSHYDTYAMPAGMRLREPLRASPIRIRMCAPTLDTTVTLTNFGGEPLSVSSASFVAGSASVYRFPAPPFTVFAGASRDIQLRIAAPQYGVNYDTLIVATTTSGSRPLRIPVEIYRDSLALDPSTRSIVFPAASDATPTRDTSITVVNTGTGAARLSAVSFSGPFALVSPALPIDIASGDSIVLTLRYAPPATGAHTGSATLTVAPCGVAPVIALSGQRARSAAIDVSTPVIPDVGCGSGGFSDTSFVIRNTGGSPLRFDSVEVRPAGNSVFTVSAPPIGTMIAPGDSLVARLRFAPPSPGVYTFSLRIWNSVSPGGYLLIGPFTGSRVAIAPVASTSSIDFGARGACEGDTAVTITVRNDGSSPMRIEGLLTATGAFAATPPADPELAPGESVEVIVRFAPTVGGVFNDTLRIVISPCDTTLLVALSGERQTASLSSNVDTLDLGTIATCDLPARGGFLLVNSGSVALDVRSITIDNDLFTLGAVADPMLSPGASMRIDVSIASAGMHTARITVRAMPCSLEHTLVVRATVVPRQIALNGDLDFGAPMPNVPVLRTATLVNTSAMSVTIDRIGFGSSVPGLRVVAPATPLTLGPGESRAIDVEYLASAPTAFSTDLIVGGVEPCDTAMSVAARSRGGALQSLSFVLPDTSAPVDALVSIPLRLRRVAESDDRVIATTTVRWDRSMLALEGVRTNVAGSAVAVLSDVVNGNERAATIRYTGDVPIGGADIWMSMRVLIGSSDRTTLALTESSARGADIGSEWAVVTRDGSFATLGICDIGGGRYIRIAGVFAVSAVAPIPAGDAVVLTLSSDAAADVGITLVDALGRTAGTLLDAPLPSGSSTITLDVSSVPAGVYQLYITSGRHVERVPIIVRR